MGDWGCKTFSPLIWWWSFWSTSNGFLSQNIKKVAPKPDWSSHLILISALSKLTFLFSLRLALMQRFVSFVQNSLFQMNEWNFSLASSSSFCFSARVSNFWYFGYTIVHTCNIREYTRCKQISRWILKNTVIFAFIN